MGTSTVVRETAVTEQDTPPPPPSLPLNVQEALSRREPGGDVLHGVETDLLLDGRYGRGFLVATVEWLYGIAAPEDGLAEIRVEVPLSTVEKLEVREFHGAGLLEAVTPERAVRVARFTRARMPEVREFRHSVLPLLPEQDGKEERRGGWSRPKKDGLCEKCGAPVPHWLAGVCPRCLDKRAILGRLFARVRAYWVWISIGLVLTLGQAATGLVQPMLSKVLIDRVLPQPGVHAGNLPLLWQILALILALNVAGSVLQGVRSYFSSWLGEKVTLDLRRELYNHLQTLSLSFYDSKQTGWIMDRVTSDTNNLQDFLTTVVQDFIRDCIAIIGIAVLLFSLNVPLAFAALIPLPFIVFMSVRFLQRTRKMYHLMWRRRARLTTLLSDVVPGVRVVKAFAQEEREKDRYEQYNREYMGASLTTARYNSVIWPIAGSLSNIGFAIVWGYGGYLAISGEGVTAGTLVAFIGYLWQFYSPIQNLSQMTQRVQRAATSAQRIFEILDTKPSVPEPEKPKEMPPIVGEVEFRDVVFGYDANQPVLKGVSFTVKPGEMVGLVGPSGAGKSTTINLVSRFYDVDDGAILIDGIDIRDVSLHSLRSQIGVVLQEPFLFHGSIAENISYGKPEATLAEIIRAAKAANAHDFIMRMPDGYDTLVGERGTRLSGGERQRVSIARAILKDPRILILDEATSSVDTETEAYIREAIDRLVKNRTTFAIAHRFSTLRNADRLVVLEKGRVAEVGTHEELMAKEDGLFRRLTDMQSELSRIIAVGG